MEMNAASIIIMGTTHARITEAIAHNESMETPLLAPIFLCKNEVKKILPIVKPPQNQKQHNL